MNSIQPGARGTSGGDSQGVDSLQWRRVHKITPLTQMGAIWLVLVVVVANGLSGAVQNGGWRELLEQSSYVPVRFVLWGLAALIGVSLVVLAVSYLVWRATAFAMDNTGVHWRSGILLKKHVQVRWDRVQSVEIQQKLFGRIFGFGTVRVESAGSEDDVNLGLLRIADCVSLRSEVLGRLEAARSGRAYAADSSGFAHTAGDSVRGESASDDTLNAALASTDGVQDTGTDQGIEASGIEYGGSTAQMEPGGISVGVAPGAAGTQASQYTDAAASGIESGGEPPRSQIIYELGAGRLAVAKLLDLSTIFMLLFVIGGGIGSVFVDFSIFAVIVVFAGALWAFLKSLFDEFGTRISLSRNGLRKRSGLTKLVTRTYPPQRVHAFMIDQPILWRLMGWWRLSVSVAGVNASDVNDLVRVLALAGTKNEILRVMWALLPSLGASNDAELTEEALAAKSEPKFFKGATPKAKLLDPISWRSRGVALTNNVMVIRSGRWHRKVSVVLQDHTQSLGITQGPVQRRLGLATLRADLVLGTVNSRAKNLELADAREFLEEERLLSAQARALGVSESLNEWKARVGVN